MEIDKLLDDDMETGSNQSFNVFIYTPTFNTKNTTALMCAAFNDSFDKVDFLCMPQQVCSVQLSFTYKKCYYEDFKLISELIKCTYKAHSELEQM